LFDFTAFPILETERLMLREIIPGDADALFRIRGDYEVTKYNIGAAYYSVDQANDLIAGMAQAYREEKEIRWGITLKDQPTNGVVGMIGYNYWIRRDARASVGYDLARAFWGQGIMTEALDAVVAFGFRRMGLNRIEADADARNPASARVLKKAGFRQEGLQQEQFYEDSSYNDLVLFALLRKDYKQQRSG
jgi:ribosomal-protein-alanine N-acetyltransferase